MRYLLTADLYNPFVEKGIKFPVAGEEVDRSSWSSRS